MRSRTSLLFLAVLSLIMAVKVMQVEGLYSSNSKVVKLTQANFNSLVISSKDPWLVEFYAPWCGHCKNLAPEYEKAAAALDGIVKVGAVDMTENESVGAPYGISGFPTIKFFGAKKQSPVDYNLGRTAKDIVGFVMDQAKSIALSRLGGSAGSSSSGSGSGSRSSGGADTVVVLTESNFNALVLGSNDNWMVEFYAPWCGHCKKLQPEWEQSAKELQGQVKFGKVDCTVETGVCSRFGVSGYPTIKYFPPKTTRDSNAIPYEGGRDSSSISNYAREQRARNRATSNVGQLISSQTFEEYCHDSSTLVCIIVFLPHIYDSTVEERNNYIEVVKTVNSESKSAPMAFLWAQGGDFYELEESLNMAVGYPAVTAISMQKKKYAIMRGAFTASELKQFVNGLLVGKEPLYTLPALPNIKTVEKWDGKDRKPTPVEDEY